VKNTFFITTTLPYVNADPHIGHAVEFIRADSIARYQRAKGREVFFNTGTDEHGVKVYRKALEAEKDPQSYADEYAERFKNFCAKLNISRDNFIRTTDENHVKAAQEFWRQCDKNGYIYKKAYSVKYCVGCELEKTDSELIDGKCPDHPNRELEIIEEENYFFKFSAFQEKLLNLYGKNPDFVLPESRMKEIRKFVENGLQDFSISRLKEKMPWGIPVPGDENQVMYVWFDALVNYISAVGWPDDADKFNKWWPAVQIAGKDNLRQQSAMWQAMLMSVNLPPSKKILINGFILLGGQKMSKSLGNTIDPMALAQKYGTDAVRYYLLRETSQFEDGDITIEKFETAYNANLVNGLGNLTSRIMKMAETYGVKPELPKQTKNLLGDFMENYKINEAIDGVWKEISETDKYIQDKKPFSLVKTDETEAKEIIGELVIKLWNIAVNLEIFLPETAEKIQKCVKENKMPETPLFPRI
jgi:methionyl-tRNA synthetase